MSFDKHPVQREWGNVRTQDAPKPRREARGEPLGYSFDPVPKSVPEMIRDGRLGAIDAQVLAVLLRFRKRVRHSCWCSKATVAAKLGRSPRTVQRSLFRLGQAGLIEQAPMESPDPDDPGNRTGWRIVFLWLTPADYRPGSGPVRAGLGTQKKAPQGDIFVSPPRVSPETEMSPPPETLLSPNHAGASNGVLDGPEPDGETPPSSSSPRACEAPPVAEAPGPDDDDDRSGSVGGEEKTPEGVQAAVEAAVEQGWHGFAREIPGHAAEVERDFEAKGLSGRWDCYAAGIRKAAALPPEAIKAIRNMHRYVLASGRDLLAKGAAPTAPTSGVACLKEHGEREAAEFRKQLEETERRCREGLAEEDSARARQLVESTPGYGIRLVLDADGMVRQEKTRPSATGLPASLVAELRSLKPFVVEVLRAERPAEAPGPAAEPQPPAPAVEADASADLPAAVNPAPSLVRGLADALGARPAVAKPPPVAPVVARMMAAADGRVVERREKTPEEQAARVAELKRQLEEVRRKDHPEPSPDPERESL